MSTAAIARRALGGAAALLMWVPAALAQSAQPPKAASPSFGITDNSFLVEEAFNQGPGIFQTIVTFQADRPGEWDAAVTEEWPLGGQRHQISYTIPFSGHSAGSGLGDIAVHYRLQVWDEDGRRPALSPRVSLIVPSGEVSRDLGAGHPGWEVNLPVSRQFSDVYLHANAGFTHFPKAAISQQTYNLFTPRLAGSVIWQAAPMFHLMLESVLEWDDQAEAPGVTRRDREVTVLPGLRTGWNAGSSQTIVGIGAPLTRAGDRWHSALMLYLSYEGAFSTP